MSFAFTRLIYNGKEKKWKTGQEKKNETRPRKRCTRMAPNWGAASKEESI